MTGDRSIRWLTAAAVIVVAAIAAVVSFVHIKHLAVTHGQTRLAALLLPLSIDGTVVVASLVMFRVARAGLNTPWLARSMLALAVTATLAANVGYGLPFGMAGALISGWPAVAFVGSVEMVIGMVRRIRQSARGSVLGASPQAASASAYALNGRAHPERPRKAPGGRTSERTEGRSRSRARSASVSVDDAEREFTADLASGAVPSLRSIRARQERARVLREHLQTVTGST